MRDTDITRREPRPKKTSHYTSSLGSLETVSEEQESEQHEPGGEGGPGGAFPLERVEHETGGAFGPEGATSEELEPEKACVPEPEADESGEDSFDGESESELDQGGQSGAHQEVPAAVRKLYDSFTGTPQSITQSHMRSGRDAASLQAPMRTVDVNHLPPEPTTLREVQASPEWPNWQRARKSEMDWQLACQASIKIVIGIAAVKDWELRQLDVGMAYLEAGVKRRTVHRSTRGLPRFLRPGGPTAKGNVRPCARRIVMAKKVQR